MRDELQILMTRLEEMADGFWRHLPKLVIAILVVVATWLVARYLSRAIVKLIARTHLRKSIQDLFTKIVGAAIWLAGLMVAAVVVFPTLTPGKFMTVFGIGSVAIGFAFKEVFENFLAGVMILLRDTIELGDVVECDGTVGRVERITVRDTHIRRLDGERVVLPNAALFRNPVRILTDRDKRRVTIVCGVAYDTDLAQAAEVMTEAVASADTVAGDEPVEVFAGEFGASSVDFAIRWWTGSSPLDVHRSRDEVVRRVHAALDEAGIEIPFPHRTLTFPETLQVVGAESEVAATGVS